MKGLRTVLKIVSIVVILGVIALGTVEFSVKVNKNEDDLEEDDKDDIE